MTMASAEALERTANSMAPKTVFPTYAPTTYAQPRLQPACLSILDVRSIVIAQVVI